MPPSQDEGQATSSSFRKSYLRPSKSSLDRESSPLLAGPSISIHDTTTRRHSSESLAKFFDTEQNLYSRPIQHSSDEAYFLDLIMEKVKSTKFAHFVDKLAVESEPGLTNAQLMLNNHDLKPGLFYKTYPSQ